MKPSLVRPMLGLLLAMGLALAVCEAPNPPAELTVLAGSELEDMQPLLPRIEAATGIHLNLRFGGTLEITERIEQGEAADLAWLSQAKYLALLPGGAARIAAQDKIMLSPVVLGVKESAAKKFGWIGNSDVTWRNIADKAASGELRYAMTDPGSSNTGFSALLGVAAAFSESGDAIRPETVDRAAITRFFKGQHLTAGSSGWLVDAYVRSEAQLNGIINYESVLMRLNASGRLQEKLYLVYPKEGIVTADYPLMLLNPAQRPAYDKLVAYLRSPEFQQAMMDETLRRPVIPQVKPGPAFPSQLLVELPFPASKDAIDRILFAYFDEYRRPAHVVFVLEVSGSMQGKRLASLKTALDNLTGLDRSLTGQFARFRGREKITLIPFESKVHAGRTFTVNDPLPQGADMQAVRSYAQSLATNGSTALYDALRAAYETVAKAERTEPDRAYSIVLMSDGEANAGMGAEQFEAEFQALPEPVRQAKTYTVLFGESSDAAMEHLAQLTGGKVFDGRSSLGAAFKAIRGYQ